MKLKLLCNKCGHKWIRRGERLPLRCPNPVCQSPYWNKTKKVK